MNNRSSRNPALLVVFLILTVLMAVLFMPGLNSNVSEGFQHLTSTQVPVDQQTQIIYDAITCSKSIDILAMLLLGFGFLMVFTRKHEFTTLTATMVAVSVSIPVYMII